MAKSGAAKSSALYSDAKAALTTAQRKALNRFERWLDGIKSSVPKKVLDGKRLRQNLREESHLTDMAPFGDSAALATFLKVCAKAHGRSRKRADRMTAYSAHCNAHGGRGLRIAAAPSVPQFLRYATYRKGIAFVVERLLGQLARRNFEAGVLSLEDAFEQITQKWDATRLTARETLGGGALVFATFDHPGGAPRDDAKRMANALAHPILLDLTPASDEFLYEFSYPTAAVAGFRFPTVADAGWIHLFRPAPDREPDPTDPATLCGWTGPLGGEAKQPELLHENASMTILNAPPRLVGRLT